MKFKITRSNFINGLKAVQNIVGGKGSLAILQNVLIEAEGKELKMITTDLDISIKTTEECEVIEPGKTTLPVKYLFNMISKFDECEILVEIDSQERATISAGNTKFKLAGMPEKDFPSLPKNEEAYEYKLPQDKFKDMLRKVAYAASQDDTRRTLKGVLVSFKDSKLTMVATDGRRLAMKVEEIELPQSAEKDIVLPAKAVVELQRSLVNDGDMGMMVQNTQICFKLPKMTIYSKLIDDVYPNYKQVIPAETKESIAIDRVLLLSALERASVMTIDEAHSIKLIFENGFLTVTSAVSDIGEAKDQVPIKYAGEKIEIMFNPNYVMDPLKAIDDDEITFNLNDGHSPAIIKCNVNNQFLYVLMPLRIN